MHIKSEWQLLDTIKEIVKKKGVKAPEDLAISIGDDCAAFRLDSKRFGLITTDISLEPTHFKRELFPLEDIGFKTMMGSISDIVAMGGSAKFAFISLGIPAEFLEKDIVTIYEGLLDAANRAGICIAGGDISKSSELTINVAIYGEVTEDQLTMRKGARCGDIIYITGNVGDSKAGLEILLSSDEETHVLFNGLIQKHKRPTARFNIIDEIIHMFDPSSMIDISDGILSDLRHICNESCVGFRINEEKLPISKELCDFSSYFNKVPYQYALTSGEEYELLFTSNRQLVETMSLSINNIAITPIGEIIDKGSYIIRNKQSEEIAISGFDHFKN